MKKTDIDWTATAKAAAVWSILSLGGPLIIIALAYLSWELVKSPRAVLRWLTG